VKKASGRSNSLIRQEGKFVVAVVAVVRVSNFGIQHIRIVAMLLHQKVVCRLQL
jgi:hypothetical protein